MRLETRFVNPAPDRTELLVRVYPDAIHMDSHEPRLSADEREWGQHYWASDWRAGDETAQRMAAWRQLADRFGAARAGWIARTTRPLNLPERPAAPTPDGQAPSPAPVFPAIAVEPSGASWRSPAQARLLPARWTAVLHSEGKVALRATGKKPIRQPLAIGPDPRAALADPETQAAVDRGEQLAVDPGMAWMVDFQTAEDAGMALRIPLRSELLQAGIESLLVFGIADGDGRDRLGDLLDAHRHTEGLAFVEPGFATKQHGRAPLRLRLRRPGSRAKLHARDRRAGPGGRRQCLAHAGRAPRHRRRPKRRYARSHRARQPERRTHRS